jgi:hypothetical protein
MSSAPPRRTTSPRALIAIPVYNEAATIEPVLGALRSAVPELDVLVIDDGSSDDTPAILSRLGQRTATHCCNLGYGRAVQTALKYAQQHGYDALITCDADGQHRPADVRRLYDASLDGSFDVLIGSRFMERRRYDTEPFTRRVGMRLFSTLIAVLTGVRVYDTSSGLKVIERSAFKLLISRPFVDFHAEAIAYLLEHRLRVGEFPITVSPRTHGTSMYNALSALTYPLKVSFLIVLSVVEAGARRRYSRA